MGTGVRVLTAPGIPFALILLQLLAWPGMAVAESPYERWENGPSTDPAYFPIGVWLQDPANAATYRDAGVNFYVGLWAGPTVQQLETLRAAGVQVVPEQNATGLAYDQTLEDGRPVIVGWHLPGEPDNYPPDWPDEVQSTFDAWAAADPTRPIQMNLGQGIGWDDGTWIGQGGVIEPDVHYPAYIEASDIASFDIYPMSSTYEEVYGDAWRVALGIDRLREYSPPEGRILWSNIETGNIHATDPDRRATPKEIAAEVWMSIVHGSRGIIYFIHGKSSFGDFDPMALLREENRDTFDAIAVLNHQIHELASVINGDPSTVNVAIADVLGSTPVDTMVRDDGGLIYLFAVGMRAAQTTKRFDLGIETMSTVEVIGEGRTIALSNGVFEDDFAGYEAHVYAIPVPEPSRTLMTAAAVALLGMLSRIASSRDPGKLEARVRTQ